MSEKEENTLKISVPLITDEEIRRIDNNFNSIVDEFTKQFIHDKELAIAQHIIQKQQKELEKKDKILDLMAEFISKYHCFEIAVFDIDNECKHEHNCKECVKQYFEKKSEEDK